MAQIVVISIELRELGNCFFLPLAVRDITHINTIVSFRSITNYKRRQYAFVYYR